MQNVVLVHRVHRHRDSDIEKDDFERIYSVVFLCLGQIHKLILYALLTFSNVYLGLLRFTYITFPKIQK